MWVNFIEKKSYNLRRRDVTPNGKKIEPSDGGAKALNAVPVETKDDDMDSELKVQKRTRVTGTRAVNDGKTEKQAEEL